MSSIKRVTLPKRQTSTSYQGFLGFTSCEVWEKIIWVVT
jgi:hypothetical protein